MREEETFDICNEYCEDLKNIYARSKKVLFFLEMSLGKSFKFH